MQDGGHECVCSFSGGKRHLYACSRLCVEILQGEWFASEFDIEVTVKTTGHSYPGSSTAADSMLIWMANYPKDGTITTSYADSCGTTTDAVVGIGGGETWNDVIEAVNDQYHVVTGGGRTVSAAGGWLQGGGLSFSSREYGLGVDNAVDFRVVLANGTVVTADACANPDLFWALRGGGGGTFGVVTHVSYKLHPKVQVVKLDWGLLGFEAAVAAGKVDAVQKFVSQFLEFWVANCPDLDSRWSGFFAAANVHLTFMGSEADAKSTFIDTMQDWYDTVLDRSEMIPGVWGALAPQDTITVYDSWYAYKGGVAAANNPQATDATGDAYAGVSYAINARLWPYDTVKSKPTQVQALLEELALASKLGPVNYFLGGKIREVAENATAMHPAARRALWMVTTTDEASAQRVRDFLPNDVTGVCYNHHSVVEPDWRNACWGSNYGRLEELKEQYDPAHRFNGWHLVGYKGDELPETAAGSPAPSCVPRLLPPAGQDSVGFTYALDMGRAAFLEQVDQYKTAVATASGVAKTSVFVTEVASAPSRRGASTARRSLLASLHVATQVLLTDAQGAEALQERLMEGVGPALQAQGFPAGSFAEQPTVLDKSPAPTTTTTPPPATSSSSALRRTCSDLSSQGLLSAAAVLLAISAYATA